VLVWAFGPVQRRLLNLCWMWAQQQQQQQPVADEMLAGENKQESVMHLMSLRPFEKEYGWPSFFRKADSFAPRHTKYVQLTQLVNSYRDNIYFFPIL
jgi:hypothetical protein